MTLFQSIVLGAVQGVTEFLPISSTAHLILVPTLMGWPDPGLTFDVALHIGTVAAMLTYFAPDFRLIVAAGCRSLWARDLQDPYQRLAWMIVLGSIPAGVAGVLGEKWIESTLRSPLIIGASLMLVAVAILLADRRGADGRSWKELGIRDALVIGFGQACALIPGFSRSGSTMLAGLVQGLSRASAARFSFLLGTPITLASCLFKLKDLFHQPLASNEAVAFAAGIATSGIVGYASIRFLLRYLAEQPLAVFMYYRIALGLLVIGLTLGGLI